MRRILAAVLAAALVFGDARPLLAQMSARAAEAPLAPAIVAPVQLSLPTFAPVSQAPVAPALLLPILPPSLLLPPVSSAGGVATAKAGKVAAAARSGTLAPAVATGRARPAAATLAAVAAESKSSQLELKLDGFFDGRADKPAFDAEPPPAEFAPPRPSSLKPSRQKVRPEAFAGLALVGAGLTAYAADAAYSFANGLSVLGSLLPLYESLRKGHARDYPLGRALLGAAGALALGVINATVLGKPGWGIAHIFSALALLAPALVKRRAPPAVPGQAFAPAMLSSRSAAAWTAAAAVALGLVSAGVYALAAASIPLWLAALPAATVGQVLLGVQFAKAGLFVAMFIPEIRAFFNHKSDASFQPLFTLAYFASTASFVLWGLQAAAASPPGAIREQYLVHAFRNMAEAGAALLALLAMRHGRKRP